MASDTKMIRIAVSTLGCKVNQYESAGILGKIEGDFDLVPFNTPADIYIVNTCTVTEKTDYQSRQLIKRAHRLNSRALIFVTGCYAQTAPEKVSSLPGVRLVAGTDQKENIPQLINRLIANGPNAISDAFPLLDSLSSGMGFGYNLDTSLPNHTRAFLKIQDGCDSFCSYCIVPYARGRSRSLNADQVLARLRALAAAGYKEIVLTGIHLGMYGQDLSAKMDLWRLLDRIEKEIPEIRRLRLSSVEPMEITDDLIKLIAQSQMICRHFHIPLQSGSNKILTDMKRCYNKQQFKNTVYKIIHTIPDAAIGIDVMAGFPGESDRDFRDTYDLLSELAVAYLHVFPYSKRKGTEAAEFSGQLSEDVKKERASILRNLGRMKRAAFNGRFIGKNLSTLIESERDRKTGLMRGFSDNYINVLITEAAPGSLFANEIYEVIGIRVSDDKLYGKVSHGRET